jgi:hypothetical protein
MSTDSCRQYGREDVDYRTWYSDWMKYLAQCYTRAELEVMLHGKRREASIASAQHLRAIQATTSMQGQSQRRARTRNVAAAAGEYAIALRGALEIYDLFPEHTKEGA